jgi:WYL domain
LTTRPRKNRWSVERRLEFIDFRLFWDGRINRGDLIDLFGISIPQASADLSQYQELAKGNIVYDKQLKTYVAGKSFRARFFEPSAEQYLAQLRLMNAGVLSEEDSWVAILPHHSIVPTLRRRLDPQSLRVVVDAIRNRRALRVQYQSFTRPDPFWRWIAPHALAFDGFRWHTRAWCDERKDFCDFVLARILEIDDSRPSESDPKSDMGWQTEVVLRLAPHPAIGVGARKAVELDYGMVNGILEVTTRVCLSSYLERHLDLDLNTDKVTPGRQQLVLLNRPEIAAARSAAGEP